MRRLLTPHASFFLNEEIQKMKRIFLGLTVFFLFFADYAKAIDLNANEDAHPHGINSSGLGTVVTHKDNDYIISGGTQNKSNLFHSFEKFNLHSKENADFQIQNESIVKNIISRVTGDDYSWINGKIKSTNASNFYFINPNGVMFGPNATLDLKGTFHISTADYLRMEDNERFYTEAKTSELLSTSSPAAFGFIKNNPASISFENSQLNIEEDKLTTMSLIGGNIDLKNSSINASGVNINLISIDSQGELSLSDLDISFFKKLGKIQLAENSGIRTAIFDTSTGDAGNVLIKANDISLTQGSNIDSQSGGNGKGGNIKLYAKKSISFIGASEHDGYASGISATAYNAGNAGDIEINTNTIHFKDGGRVGASTHGPGNAGSIKIFAKDSIQIEGKNPKKPKYISWESGIYSRSNSIKEGAGSGGNIYIETKSLSMKDGGVITAKTSGSGASGDISMKLNNLNLDNASISSASTSKTDGGAAGRINIEAKNCVTLSNHSSLTTEAKNIAANNNADDTGKITVKANDIISLTDSKITTSVKGGTGNGGDIEINSEFAILNKSDVIAEAYEGKGGNIHIATDHFIQSSESVVSASSKLGIDGTILIESPNTDLSTDLTVLPSNFLDTARWLASRCEERAGEDLSHFIVNARDGIPTSPDDWLPSPPLSFNSISKRIQINQLLIKGEVFYNKGDFESAILTWKKEINTLDKDEIIYLHTLIYLTSAYQAVGHYEKARSSLENSLLFKITQNSLKKLNMVRVPENIIAELKKLENQIYNRDEFITILNKTLSSMEIKNHKSLILKHSEKFSPISKSGYFNALLYSALSDLYLSTGNVKDAKKYAELAISTQNPQALAVVLNNMGNVFAVKKDYNGAILKYKECLKYLELADPSPDVLRLKSRVLINMLRADFNRTHNYERIIETINNAILNTVKLPDSYEKAFDFISLTHIIKKSAKKFNSSDFRRFAYNLLKEALRISKKIEHITILSSYCYGYLGQLYEEEQNYSDAIKLTNQAVFAAQLIPAPELLCLWKRQVGNLLKFNNNIKDSIEAYRDAINILKPVDSKCEGKCGDNYNTEDSEKKRNKPGVIQEFLSGGYRRHVFDEKVKPVFLEFASLLLDKEDLREVVDILDSTLR